METSEEVTGCSFTYSNPSTLEVWLEYDLQELE